MMYAEYLMLFLLALVVSFLLTPFAKRIAVRVGAIDKPDSRKVHNAPIPRLGGIAIIAGFIISIVIGITTLSFKPTGPDGLFADSTQFMGFCLGLAAIIITGILDDIYCLSPKVKILVQSAAAFCISISGTRIQVVSNPFSVNGVSILPDWFSYVLTIMWLIGITNAINLIDGLDGLAAGITTISSLSIFIVSVLLGRWETAVFTAALAGAILGFLPYNFNPAKIFMGDTGATFLGFTLGVISIPGTLKSFTAIAVAVPILALGLPLFDTIFAIVRRARAGKPIMSPDREHLHHRLIDIGLSQKQTVVIMYILSALLGLCAVVLADRGAISAIVLVVSVILFITAGAFFLPLSIFKTNANTSMSTPAYTNKKAKEDNYREDSEK